MNHRYAPIPSTGSCAHCTYSYNGRGSCSWCGHARGTHTGRPAAEVFAFHWSPQRRHQRPVLGLGYTITACSASHCACRKFQK